MTIEAHGQDTSDGRGTTVTADASADTKGAWTQIAASTTNNNEWITITMESDENDMPFLVDIGVGAAASESVLIANIPYTSNASGGGMCRVTLPVTIASGTRVSARCQAATGSRTVDVSIHLVTESAFGTSASNITLGADTTNSVGTAVDAGGSANTKGAWTELVASTSADIDYFAVFIAQNGNPVIGSVANFLVDIGTGAAASESVLVANIPYIQTTFEINANPTVVFFQNIPSGTRVAARCQSTETDATDRIIDVAIIGCNMTAPSGGGGMKLAGRGGLAA